MNNSGIRLILGSASPRRRELLKAAGFDFEVIAPHVPEIENYLYPPYIPLLNAMLKADAVAKDHPNALVIGADTVISFEDNIIGKPASESDAVDILCRLSGKVHEVITGVRLRSFALNIRCDFAEISTVRFKNFTASTARDYVKRVHTLDKAGAYAIQEHGDMIVAEISGSLDNIIGLPCDKLKTAISAARTAI